MNRSALTGVVVIGGLLLGSATIAQYSAIKQLRAEIAALKGEPAERLVPGNTERTVSTVRMVNDGTAGQRLARLEMAVDDLVRATDYLMERGALPPSPEKTLALQSRVMDNSLPDNERLQALRLLRRNGALPDEVLMASMNWMQASTNGGIKRAILAQMEGSTNPILKSPLLAMLESEQSGQVREEAVQRLRAFADDAAVEDKLWQLAVSDGEGDVRQEALEALTEGKVSETRLAAFKTLATDPSATAEERIAAITALRRTESNAPEVIAKVAEMALQASDPSERARVFGALDGLRDDSLKAPLVAGLQDPNPFVRQQAADTLSGMSKDPLVNQWLQHISQNDPDPRVRREAWGAMQEGNGGNGGGRGGPPGGRGERGERGGGPRWRGQGQ